MPLLLSLLALLVRVQARGVRRGAVLGVRRVVEGADAERVPGVGGHDGDSGRGVLGHAGELEVVVDFDAGHSAFGRYAAFRTARAAQTEGNRKSSDCV